MAEIGGWYDCEAQSLEHADFYVIEGESGSYDSYVHRSVAFFPREDYDLACRLCDKLNAEVDRSVYDHDLYYIRGCIWYNAESARLMKMAAEKY